MLLFLWAFSLFHHAEPEPVKAGGGFMLRSGRRVIWRLEMDSTPWAFPLVISTQDHWRKESHSGEKKLCVLLWFLHSFFCRLGLGERGRGLREKLLCFGRGLKLVWFGQKFKTETRKCLEATPQDLLFVVGLPHWLPQHLHVYPIMSL